MRVCWVCVLVGVWVGVVVWGCWGLVGGLFRVVGRVREGVG